MTLDVLNRMHLGIVAIVFIFAVHPFDLQRLTMRLVNIQSYQEPQGRRREFWTFRHIQFFLVNVHVPLIKKFHSYISLSFLLRIDFINVQTLFLLKFGVEVAAETVVSLMFIFVLAAYVFHY